MREFLFCIFLPFFSIDASSSNEAVHLQQRLKSLGSELVTLRNRLHVSQRPADVNAIDGSIESTAGCKVAIANIITSASNRIASTGQFSAANVQLMSATQSKSVTDHKINTKVFVKCFLFDFTRHLRLNCFTFRFLISIFYATIGRCG